MPSEQAEPWGASETTPRRSRGVACLVVAVGMALVGAGLATWSGGFGATVGGPDLYAMHVARYRYIAETYLAGRLPLWNPYEFCGVPLLGAPHASALYAPVVAANMLLSANAALQVLYHAHFAAYVFLTLLYLTRHGMGLVAASAGAALAAAGVLRAFADAGADHPVFLFSLTWVPAILLAWDAAVAGSRRAIAALALLLAVQWLPGYPEFPLVTAVVLVVAAAIGARSGLVRRLGLALAVVAVGAIAAAVQVLPLAETVAESARVDFSGTYHTTRALFSVHGPWDLANTVFRRFGGAAVVAIVLGLLLDARRRPVWLLLLLWSLFPANRPFAFLYEVPPFSGLRFLHAWNLMAPLFAGAFAAAGLERMRRGESRPWITAACAAAVGVLALIAPVEGVGAWPIAAAAAACVVAAVPALRRGVFVVPAALVWMHAAWIFANVGTAGPNPAPDFEALAARLAVLRDAHARFPDVRVLSGPEIRAGIPLRERLPSPVGYEAAVPPRRIVRLVMPLRLLAFSWEGESFRGTWQRIAAAPVTAGMLGIGLVAVPPRQHRLLQQAGYRTIAQLPDGDFVLHHSVPPRFRIVHEVRRAADEAESLGLVTDPKLELSAMVILEDAPPVEPAPPPAGAHEAVEVVLETPERIELTVTLGAPGVLVMRDAFYPGWRARVDGETAPVLRADYAFRAVALAAGRHSVVLFYRPMAVVVGLALSVIAVSGLVVFALASSAPSAGGRG